MSTLNHKEPTPCGMRLFRSWAAAPRLKGLMKVRCPTISGGWPRLAASMSRAVSKSQAVDFAQLPNEVVPKFSEMMRERVEANMRRTDNLDPNDTNYRTVLVTDANTNGKIKEFYRARPFTDDFKLPGRRVVRINAPEQRTLYSSNRREAASTWF